MPKLPNLSGCEIPEAKLTNYLLDLAHPDGGAKAKFLLGFGFSAATPETLRDAILAHAASCEISDSRQTEFGTIFEVEGYLLCPDGSSPFVRIVWMIDTGQTEPRLITLVPAKDDAR